MSTLKLANELTPCAQSRTSESEMLNQNSSSATRSSTGSLMIPPVLIAKDHVSRLHRWDDGVDVAGD